MLQSKSVIAESSAIKEGLKKYQGNPESIWLWGRRKTSNDEHA
jgi:hypothetical protein